MKLIATTATPVRPPADLSGLIRVPVIASPSRPQGARQPVRAAAPSVGSSPLRRLTGCAVLHEVKSYPLAAHHRADGGQSEEVRSVIRAGTFDGYLRLVYAGKAVVRLLVDHDQSRELAATSDGSLRVWARPDGLFFSTNPRTRRGAAAGAFAHANPALRECSVGFINAIHIRAEAVHRRPVLDIHRADVTEISLVPSGAFPGTWVRVGQLAQKAQR